MKISKRTRRDAADLCAMMATIRQAALEGIRGAVTDISMGEVAELVGASDKVQELADHAFIDSEYDTDTDTDRAVAWWAEADAMIRDGWSE